MRWQWRLCEGFACMLIRRMTRFRYNLLPFCNSPVSIETLHDLSEEQASFDTSMQSAPWFRVEDVCPPNSNFQKT